MVLGTYFLAEDIFRIGFGSDWTESGRIAIWMLPMFALGLIASPLSYMSYLVEKPHIDLLWQIGLMIISAIVLYSFPSYQLTLVGYGLAYALMYMLYIYMSYRFSCGEDK
jgi:O-antigen/teichoic acid export membrane protein